MFGGRGIIFTVTIFAGEGCRSTAWRKRSVVEEHCSACGSLTGGSGPCLVGGTGVSHFQVSKQQQWESCETATTGTGDST